VVDGPVSIQVGGRLESRIPAGSAVGGPEPRLVFSVYKTITGEAFPAIPSSSFPLALRARKMEGLVPSEGDQPSGCTRHPLP
jgi:hypothetical protein